MSPTEGPTRSSVPRRAAQVLVVSSVMFTFIGAWRTAAVVLCDLASTSYYIGGIVETSIGKAAPWFILAVMLFSYAVRWVYIESCTLFLRGGVYRVVREALGRIPAKLAVSALMFDYILTGPISGVAAGQYVVGLIFAVLRYTYGEQAVDPATADVWKRWGAVALACGTTLYFFRQNLRGIHESSDKALKIVVITTIMGALILGWCGLTLAVQGPGKSADGQVNTLTTAPDFHPHPNFAYTVPEGQPPVLEDPLGFASDSGVGEALRDAGAGGAYPWLSFVGLFGVAIAFGHSILAMSGEETLAQVYREVESPKLQNFKRAAFIVFAYSLVLTVGISFLAVLLIPDDVRMKDFSDNLIGGLALNVWGPKPLLLLLNAFVVLVGFLILSGAVNTAIIGSNGVLNRVAEDGVLPEWVLKPHKKFGTTYRLLYLIVGLQLFTIFLSRGDVIFLGEAYAFGVVWSFVFQALSMVVLRFKDKRPREFKVPLNLRLGGVEIPVGLLVILGVLLTAALTNLVTKEKATIGGLAFTSAFFVVFWVSETYSQRKRRGGEHEHLEQFNEETTAEVTAVALGLTKKYRKLVSIRSTQNLIMLEKALAETDPETTGIVVMTAKVLIEGEALPERFDLDAYDRQLMTAVVQKAESAGKEVKPLVVPTNNPLHAVLKTAKDLQAHELIVGASNKWTADEQLEQIAFYWISLHHGQPAPLTVRVLGRDRDMAFDLGGGNRIPKIGERRARSVAELRASGVGVDRVLFLHDGSPTAHDLFLAVLTALDPAVTLDLAAAVAPGQTPDDGPAAIQEEEERARRLGRAPVVHDVSGDVVATVLRLAREQQYDTIVVPLAPEMATDADQPLDGRARAILLGAPCPVLLASAPAIPHEVVDTQPPTG